MAARLCGKRIEVTGARSETMQVWALPEGGLTSQVHAGPVRFKQGDVWKPVDLTLQVQADGSVAPVGHPRGLKFSGKASAGERALAKLDGEDGVLSMAWAGDLPTPVLKGNVATYAEVRPGVDLVLTATRTGYEQNFVVKNRAALAASATLGLRMRTPGVTTTPDGSGGLLFKGKGGRNAGRIPEPTMWDSRVGANSGDHLRVAPVGLKQVRNGDDVDLTLTPDAAFLADPTLLFPVTIDPSVYPTFDTFVQTGYTSDQSGSADLKLGYSDDGGPWTARSFLTWNTGYLAGAKITSATVYLWENHSWSCRTADWEVWTTGAVSTATRWTNQPAWYAKQHTSNQTKGFSSSCAAGWVSAPATGVFQTGASSGWATTTMGLRATLENNHDSWKRFNSSNAASNIPYVDITYNSLPQVQSHSTAPTTACVTGASRPYISSRTPTLQAFMSDADGGSVINQFEWYQAGGALIGTTNVTAPSSTQASTMIPAGVFAEGGSYSWRVRAMDTADNTLVSAWSQSCEFTVDSIKPGVPVVSSTLYPSIATDNTWGHGGYGQTGTFTFTPATADTDVIAYTYQLDSDTAPSTVNAGSPTTVQITPSEDGRRTLTVRAKDRAGQLSDPNTYVFNVGRAGLKLPQPGANVVKRTKLAVDGDGTYTRATFQYRRGPGAAEYDVPLAHLHKADGSAVTTQPVGLSDLGGNAIWDAVDTLGTVGGVVQIRATLYPDAVGQPGYTTQWITVTVDPDGDGAAGDDIGPGSVNLLTGDYSVSSSDADEFGLGVGRASSSREPNDGWMTQGERLPANLQQVTTTSPTGFTTGGTTTATRVTTRGQGSSTDSLQVVPLATKPAGFGATDTFAGLGDDQGALRHGMKAGKRYRVTGWIYVPAVTGLDSTEVRARRIVGFYRDSAGVYQEFRSVQAQWVDGWQELTLDLAIPAGATEAFIRLYNGNGYGSNKAVFWDNLSLKEIVAPFGPQWRGGADGGVAEVDYESLTFPSPDLAKITSAGGDYLTFGRSASGQFFPEPGAEDLSLVKVSDTVYELRELDGTTSQFVKQTETFLISTTWTSDQNSTTRYLYDSSDSRTLVKRVINATEPGIGDCTTPVPARGCEVLEYEYATATTASGSTFGNVIDQVRAVKVWSWDPAANAGAGGETAVEVANYAYDSQGRLREVWDPRLSPPLKTTYEYDTAGRLTKVTPAGQLPWMFDYGTATGDANAGRLLKVRRAALVTGTKDQLDGEVATNFVYQVPLTKAAGGPHDMNATALAAWGQTGVPTDATAVFTPQFPPTVNVATATTPGTGGYTYATTHYLDASGRETNIATPGAHIDSQEYDEFGNVVWALKADNRELALGTLPGAAAKAADLNLPADSAGRAALLASISRYSPDGLDLIEEQGPVVRIALERQLAAAGKPTLPAGSQVIARNRTVNRYDEGKPDGGTYHLLTTTITSAAVDGYPDADSRTVLSGYGAEKGGTSGWVLRKATSSTSDAGTSYTRYDSAGRIVEAWGVGSTGTDALIEKSVFYTALANTDDAACGNKPEWAGQACVSKAGGAITGHRADMPTQLPLRRVEQYNRQGSATVVAETVGSDVRRVTNVFDAANRLTSTSLTSTLGLAVPDATYEYDLANGKSVKTTAGGKTLLREYDKLGRLVTYTDADGATTRTEYDRFDRIGKVLDPTGFQTYAYDLVNEPRGMLTSMTDSVAGTFTAKYAANGQLTELKYPGGITRTDTLDASMAPVARRYVRDSDDSTIYNQTIVENTQGQWINEVYTGGSKTYGYDTLGRLTSATQTTATTCANHQYGYDTRTNRLAKRTWQRTGQLCAATETPDAIENHTYDTADRLTDTGYLTDALGRVTGMPSGVTNTYHANDMIAVQQLGNQRQEWNLDPARRLRGFTKGTVSPSVTTASLLNHYGDDSDSPRWIVENTTTGAISRNVLGPDAGLVVTTAASGSVQLQLTNLHGDVVVTTNTALTDIQVSTYDEFGMAVTGGAARYGWLGGKLRSAESLGDTVLMGVRLYAPGLGRFLQMDPEKGGSATAYDYCDADPVNCFDLDGKWPSIRKAFKWVSNNAGNIGTALGTAALVMSFVPGLQPFAAGLAVVATGFTLWGAYNDYKAGNKGSAALSAASAIPGIGGVARFGKYAKYGYTAYKATKARKAYKAAPGSRASKNLLNRAMRKADSAKAVARKAFRPDKISVGVGAFDLAKTGCGLRAKCRKKVGAYWVGTGYSRY
ncbi:RHS repeat-associated core domain-containing protein [Dactylosporangium sp. NPDC006015]|uniref:RHS repeat-associated core domain-containing protein n=1 Tax=Dactylosporangium sp. NPDC006015 TaxID=3154576 RepID=UPI0033A83821